MVMDAKTAILARAREAIERSQQGRPVREIPRNYIREGEYAPGSDEVIADMIEKLEDYSAEVIEARDDEAIANAIAKFLADANATSVVVPRASMINLRRPQDATSVGFAKTRERMQSPRLSSMKLMPSSPVHEWASRYRAPLFLMANLIKDAAPSLLFPILMWQFWSALRSFRPSHRPSIS